MFCPHCGKPNLKEAQICTSCGKNISLQTPNTSQTAPTPQPTPTTQKMQPTTPAQTPPPTSPPQTQPKPAQRIKSSRLIPLIIAIVIFLVLGGMSVFGFWDSIQDFIGGKTEVTPTHIPTPKTTATPTSKGTPTPATTTTTVSRYNLDTDGDGVPNFVEEATSYNPNLPDCTHQLGCGDVRGGKSGELNNLFILDSSGSMAGQVPGGQKMTAAKDALNKYIDLAPEAINLGLMVYGHQGSNSTSDRNISCAGIDLLAPITQLDRAALKAKVDTFQPTGWTAIADSLQKAKEAFAGKEGNINKIMLISDGIETCGGDPCTVAKELKNSKIESIIDVIGFDVDQAAKAQLQCIAQAAGGEYFDVTTTEEFKKILLDEAERGKELIDASDCIVNKTTDYIACMIDQAEKAASYLIPICDNLFTTDPLGNEFQECDDALLRMSVRVSDLGGEAIEKAEEDIGKFGEEYDQTTEEYEQLLEQYDL